MYEIIEDCSPYYIRFTYPSLNTHIELGQKYLPNESLIQKSNDFKFINLPYHEAKEFVSTIPMSQQLPKFDLTRVTYFVSSPNLYVRAHVDGNNHKWGINFPILILDDLCLTSWYSQKDIETYIIDSNQFTARLCRNFQRKTHIPLKSMIARPNECVLFNVNIFHDWDNFISKNHRVLLTLRLESHFYNNCDFDDAKKKLFN